MTRFVLALSLLPLTMSAQQTPETPAPGFHDEVVTVGDVEHRYVVYVPQGYDADGAWPLILFLNGRGECGTDGRKQAEVGLGAAIRARPERWPFVVVFPQKPEHDTQWGDHDDLVLATLAKTERELSIDPDKRFLTGLSQGGSGSWQLGAQHADTWAAVAPICGYRRGDWTVAALKDTPVWAFHGDADNVVPMEQSKLLTAELREAGGAPALTIYPGVNHNSWDPAYRDSALAEWFRLIAAGQATGARYLADRAAADVAELRLVVAPREGKQAIDLKVEASGGAIRIAAAAGEGGAGEGGAEQGATEQGVASAEEGEPWQAAPNDAARDLVWQTLEELVRAEAFAAASVQRPEPTDGDLVTIEVVLGGPHGEWRRYVVLAADDPAAAPVVDAVDAASSRAGRHARREQR